MRRHIHLHYGDASSLAAQLLKQRDTNHGVAACIRYVTTMNPSATQAEMVAAVLDSGIGTAQTARIQFNQARGEDEEMDRWEAKTRGVTYEALKARYASGKGFADARYKVAYSARRRDNTKVNFSATVIAPDEGTAGDKVKAEAAKRFGADLYYPVLKFGEPRRLASGSLGAKVAATAGAFEDADSYAAYNTYSKWRAAATRAGAARFGGDKGNDVAFNSAGKKIGEWEAEKELGDRGYVNEPTGNR